MAEELDHNAESRRICERLMSSPEPWEVLTALNYLELQIERSLNTISKETHAWGKKILGVKFDFHQKVAVLYGLGAIDPQLAKAIKLLAEIRNDLAHSYQYCVTRERQEQFIDAVSKVYFTNSADALRAFGELYEEIMSLEQSKDDGNVEWAKVVRPDVFVGRPALGREFALAWWQLSYELENFVGNAGEHGKRKPDP